ncbi:cuticle-degrading protease, putative [Rhizoctonia solani AG-3 Rhs1AP]|uniref:Cuticle-degrading protease, putative n=1 Tax=Rhizoctonia solani AG-3 Rhs1AP TaxID=1086054 RepID=X8J007_9AGAM|nr:cuticle-degrading protease, putative [Rhizoctonia solani AG-3 Rhs1AP]
MFFKHIVVSCLLAFGAHATTADSKTYIVTLKQGINIQSHVAERREGFEIKHIYSTVFNGYSVALSPSALKALKYSKDVRDIELDQTFAIPAATNVASVQLGKVGGLPQKRANGGAGVDIYFFDTGIDTTKPCFGGRARWGASFGGYGDTDGNGHGTAMAASALCAEAGGTATSASGVAVKVLSDSGSGTTSAIISGINWAVQQYQSTSRPSIGVMAIAGAASTAMDNAVAAAVNAGFHIVVTAGFSNIPISNVSPARVSGAVTVGALPRSKTYPSNSNYGAGLDIWSFYPIACPAGITGCSTPTNSVSYVGAYMAVAIGSYGNKTPAALTTDLRSHAVADVAGVPAGTT